MSWSSIKVLVACVAGIAVATTAAAQPPAPTTAPATTTAGRGQGRGGFTPVQIGPAAPVPPQVAMLRPTAPELKAINDALQAFIAGNTSPSSAVLKKYESLITL